MGKLSYHKQHKLATDVYDMRLRLFSCIAYCTICTDAVTTGKRRQNSYIFLGVCQYWQNLPLVVPIRP